MDKKMIKPKYTCNEYREEMILAGLQRRLASKDLNDQEKETIRKEIEKLEKAMDMD